MASTVTELMRRRMGTRSASVDWESIAFQMMTGKSSAPYVDIVIPEGVTYIRQYAFRQCYVNSITFPSTLTTIGQQAFEYFHLEGDNKTLELGENITSLGNWSFQSLYKIQALIIRATTPPSYGSGAISGSFPIYVPDESVETYKTASGWSNIASKIFPISDLTT